LAEYTTTSNVGLPSYLQPYATNYLDRAQQTADMPYQPYTGQLVADQNPYQTQGLDAQAQRAMSGSGVMSAANGALPGMFSGANPGATQNPYGYAQGGAGGAQVSAQANPYAGANNPYLSSAIDLAQGDVTRNWNNVQKPQWDSAMGASGSFGNSGVMLANQQAQSDMQRNMGGISSSMRMQDYTQQQQLGESAANRNMAAQQFNSGLGESAAGRNQQNSQFNSAQGAQYGAQNDAMGNAAQSRALSALGLAPSYANQDYVDTTQLQNAGLGYQQQQQQQLNSGYQQFLDSRNYPQQQLDVFGKALGAMNYGQQRSETQPGASTAAQLAGGALGGVTLYNLFSGGR
jgi:hypothetical protein